MKYAVIILGVFAVAIILVFSSGCIGTQTTDIVIGGETVGKIYLTPNNDKLFTQDQLSEKFDMKVELFGFEFSKKGVTSSEADYIKQSLSSGVNGYDSLTNLGFEVTSGASKPDSFDEIINQFVNMPISAKDNRKLVDVVNPDNLMKSLEATAEKMREILGLGNPTP